MGDPLCHLLPKVPSVPVSWALDQLTTCWGLKPQKPVPSQCWGQKSSEGWAGLAPVGLWEGLSHAPSALGALQPSAHLGLQTCHSSPPDPRDLHPASVSVFPSSCKDSSPRI